MDQKKIEELVAAYPEAEAQIKEQAEKHGAIGVVDTIGGLAIFRRPKPAEYERHLALLFDEKSRPKAAGFLARACVVYPAREAFDAWCTEYPGIPIACADVLSDLAGASKRERGKE